MNQTYYSIQNLTSLQEVLTYLKNIKDPEDIIVFFDWDDTLVNPDYHNIIEPDITRELFDYMVKNKIYFSIITGRFHDTSCEDTLRNVYDMERNITETMFPSLEKLGINTAKYNNPEHKKIYKVYNDKGYCVGILFMGIFFSGRKGETIKHFLRQTGMDKTKKHILFIDDYEPYLMETTLNMPNIKAWRRITPYRPLSN